MPPIATVSLAKSRVVPRLQCDGALPLYQTVEQTRFADVRPTDD
jgi:hypothetical protein